MSQNSSLKRIAPLPDSLKALDARIKEMADEYGLESYVDNALQEQEQFGTPEQRLESAGYVDSDEWPALRAWLATAETFAK